MNSFVTCAQRVCGVISIVVIGLLVGCGNQPDPKDDSRREASSAENIDEVAGQAVAEPAAHEQEDSSSEQPQIDPPVEPAVSDSAAEATDPASLRDAAIEALELGETDVAFDLARKARRADAENPETIFLFSRVLAERNRFAEAIQRLDELAESVPDARLPVLGQTAEWLVIQGDWAEAEKRYESLLEQVGGGGLVSRRLAQLYLRQGRSAEAAKHLRTLCDEGNVEEVELRALLSISHPLLPEESNDDEWEPIGTLGRTRSLIAAGDLAAARAEVESEEAPDPSEVALRARVYALLNESETLQSWLDGKGKSVADADPDALFAKASLAAANSNHKDAVVDFCGVVLGDPTDAEAYRRLSESLSQLGAEEEATTARARAELIGQTYEIGTRMMQAESPSSEDIAKLSDILMQLKRPSESLAWRAVATIYAQSRSEISIGEARQRLQQINRERLAAQQDNPAELKRFLLCGVEPDQL